MSWIKASEKLPDESGEYLTFIKYDGQTSYDISEIDCDGMIKEWNYKRNGDENQQYLNSIEAWWINKYEEEGYTTYNVTKPKITVAELKKNFDDMIAKTQQLSII